MGENLVELSFKEIFQNARKCLNVEMFMAAAFIRVKRMGSNLTSQQSRKRIMHIDVFHVILCID